MSGWQPIETAPKDGQWIIAIRPEASFGEWDRVVLVRWDEEFLSWIWPDEVFDVYRDDINEMDDMGAYKYSPYHCNKFTHWMSLPTPPKGE